MSEIIISTKHKVRILTIPKYGLFLHKKQVWRSLGRLSPENHSVTAQRVAVNQHGSEVCLQNADFIGRFLVEPYKGDVPIIEQGIERYPYSEYNLSKQTQLC